MSQASQEFKKKFGLEQSSNKEKLISHKKTPSSKIQLSELNKLQLPSNISNNPYQDSKKAKNSNKSSVTSKRKKKSEKSAVEDSDEYEDDEPSEEEDEDDDDDEEEGSDS